jgi:hypothetical protein
MLNMKFGKISESRRGFQPKWKYFPSPITIRIEVVARDIIDANVGFKLDLA